VCSAPAFADERHQRLVFLGIEAGPRLCSPAVRAVKNEMGNLIEMFDRLGRGAPPTLRYSQPRPPSPPRQPYSLRIPRWEPARTSSCKIYLLVGSAVFTRGRAFRATGVPPQVLGDSCDESVSAAMPRFDEARLLRIVLERPAQLLNARRERVVAHDRSLPSDANRSAFETGSPAWSTSCLRTSEAFGVSRISARWTTNVRSRSRIDSRQNRRPVRPGWFPLVRVFDRRTLSHDGPAVQNRAGRVQLPKQ
jgi:hypothetical protein